MLNEFIEYPVNMQRRKKKSCKRKNSFVSVLSQRYIREYQRPKTNFEKLSLAGLGKGGIRPVPKDGEVEQM